MAKPKKPEPRKPAGKKSEPAVRVPLDALCGLLGKPVDDPAVQKTLAKAGTVRIKPDFIIAKDAGFDVALDRPPGAKKKVLHTLFLFPEGGDGHRGYTDLPQGFAFSTRAELLAGLPVPDTTWKVGPGEVPVETPGVSWDLWNRDGVEIRASYGGDDRAVRNLAIALPEDAMGGGSLATYPLHFATRPADAPADAELVGMALLVAWAADRCGLPAKHAGSKLGQQLANRAITPRAFLAAACAKTLTTLDVAPACKDFLAVYTRNAHSDDEGARDNVAPKIKQLLALSRDDERSYVDDFLGTFAAVVDSPFHVPDSWDAVDRIAPVIDARRADFTATRFRTAPDLALYERAAKQRDQIAITPARAALAKVAVSDDLAEQLVGLIDRALADKDVKAVLTRANLPIGKKIDQQANPALGVAYMGTKIELGGKQVLGIDAVYFYADKYKDYIRGIGAEVEFVGYAGPLPYGIRIGQARAAVRETLGAPQRSDDEYDTYALGPDRVVRCEFVDGKLAMARFGKPFKG